MKEEIRKFVIFAPTAQHLRQRRRRAAAGVALLAHAHAQNRGAAAAPQPNPIAATPSTPKSPKRVSISSSVPYSVRFVGGAGVSGATGSGTRPGSTIPTTAVPAVPGPAPVAGVLAVCPGRDGGSSGTEGSGGVLPGAAGLSLPSPAREDVAPLPPPLVLREPGRRGGPVGWNGSLRSRRPPARSTYAGLGEVGGSGAGMGSAASAGDGGGWSAAAPKSDVANVNVNALLPVLGAWFSAACALAVGTDGVAPCGGVDEAKRSVRADDGALSSGGSSGPLNTVKPGPRWTGGSGGASSLSASMSASWSCAGRPRLSTLSSRSASFARFRAGRRTCVWSTSALMPASCPASTTPGILSAFSANLLRFPRLDCVKVSSEDTVGSIEGARLV